MKYKFITRNNLNINFCIYIIFSLNIICKYVCMHGIVFSAGATVGEAVVPVFIGFLMSTIGPDALSNSIVSSIIIMVILYLIMHILIKFKL